MLLLYPGLSMARLVGTDLMQAVPLVGAAALGHLLFGDVQFHLTATLLVGALPAVYLGARLSSRAPGALVRSSLLIVLVASALKLIGTSNTVVLWVSSGVAVLAVLQVLARRRRSQAATAEDVGSRPGMTRERS